LWQVSTEIARSQRRDGYDLIWLYEEELQMAKKKAAKKAPAKKAAAKKAPAKKAAKKKK